MDANTLAYRIAQQAIGETPIKKKQPATARRGEARAASLTPARRTEIAEKAAKARWGAFKDEESPAGEYSS